MSMDHFSNARELKAVFVHLPPGTLPPGRLTGGRHGSKVSGVAARHNIQPARCAAHLPRRIRCAGLLDPTE
jgi:hypothetical protein